MCTVDCLDTLLCSLLQNQTVTVYGCCCIAFQQGCDKVHEGALLVNSVCLIAKIHELYICASLSPLQLDHVLLIVL